MCFTCFYGTIAFFSDIIRCLIENLCLDEKLLICEAQKKMKPECTVVHEDFRILQQRNR